MRSLQLETVMSTYATKSKQIFACDSVYFSFSHFITCLYSALLLTQCRH